jgi:hypothetical protein
VFADRRWAAAFDRVGHWLRGRSLPVLLVLTLLGLPLVGLVGVVAADLVPDRLVMDQLFEATERDALTIDNYPPGWSARQIDRFSECKRITIGLGDPEGVNPLESAIRSPTLGSCASAVPKIVGWAQGEGLSQSYEYARYWNGSVSVFRPVIVAVGVQGARLLAAISLLVLAVASWRALAAAVGRTAASAGAAIIVGTTDFIDLPGALLHALAWVCVLSSVMILVRHSARWSLDVLVWVAFVAGAVFLYFADMANPEAAWTAVVGSVGLASIGVVPAGRLMLRMAAAGAAWIAGFTWMWMSKWVLGATVYGVDEMRQHVSGAIEGRLDGDHADLEFGLLGGHDRVWDEWWNVLLTPIVLPVVVVAAIVLTVRRGRFDLAATWLSRLVVSSAVLIPLVWYAILRNHTQIHAWFVYRSLAVGVAIFVMAWTATPPEEAEIDERTPVTPASRGSTR